MTTHSVSGFNNLAVDYSYAMVCLRTKTCELRLIKGHSTGAPHKKFMQSASDKKESKERRIDGPLVSWRDSCL